MRKVNIHAIVSIFLLTVILTLSGCGNMDILDTNYTLNYIVVEEGGGLPMLHSIRSWSDSESDAVMVRAECCNNYIWTSSNRAVLYESLPVALTEGVDYACCPYIRGK